MELELELVTSACCLPDLSRAELFSTAKDCGYASVELFATWTKAKFTEADTAATVRGSGVGASAVHLPGDVELAKRIISSVAACGVSQVVVHGAGAPADADKWLKPLVVHAKILGVGIVLTNHKGQSIESPEHVRAAIAACGADVPGVLFEAGQYWAAGHDAIAEFARFEKDTQLIHIKDLDASGKSVPFGAGRCPLPEFLRAVAESSYRGRIVIEVEMKTTPLPQLAAILTDARQKCQEWLNVNVDVR